LISDRIARGWRSQRISNIEHVHLEFRSETREPRDAAPFLTLKFDIHLFDIRNLDCGEAQAG